MNAQTYTHVVNPVLAVLATPKYKHQQSKQTQAKKVKKQITFDSLFHAACDADIDSLLLDTTGCYGKDAKPVVGNVSSFNQTL